MKRRNRKNSGQILVLAVLVVSLVLLSTQLYILEVGKSVESFESTNVNDFVFAIKLGCEHVVISSLANTSTTGYKAVLLSSLERWTSFTRGLYQYGMPVHDFTLRNIAPYSNGTYLSWGDSGIGISSAYVDFNFSLLDKKTIVHLSYSVNVTSSLIVEGVAEELQGEVKQVNVTCNVLNEGRPALAERINFTYWNSSSWIQVENQSSYRFMDYGNGTYTVSFEGNVSQEDVIVSVQVWDQRGIFVQTNSTCTIVV